MHVSDSDDAYAAFMLDRAAGALSRGERLAADLHKALSPKGARAAALWDSVGGAILEQGEATALAGAEAVPPFDDVGRTVLKPGRKPETHAEWLNYFLTADPLNHRWRKMMFGPRTAQVGLPMAGLLRMDPGEWAPRHTHGRRDVSVVLCGSFADEFGVYERGDIAFSHAGVPHQPHAVGDTPCVCFVATEPGKPLSAFLGAFGLMDRRPAS